jgi:hypothetical protein
MKPVVRWSPKLKPGKQPGEDCIIECKEPVPLDRLTAMLAIASLVFIGVASAVLGILWDGPKKGVSLKLDANQPKIQHKLQAAVDVELTPAIPERSVGSTSGYPSSIPTQELVINDPPRTTDQTPPLTTKPTLREADTDSEARERHHLRSTRRLSAAASPNMKKRHRRSRSSFAAIGHALSFRIAQLLDKLEDR